MKRLFVSVWSLVLATSLVAHAQVVDVSIEMVPTDPKPGETVTLTAKSYGSDINQSVVSWSYNGKVIASGTGRTSVSVVTPASGAIGTITVTVNSPGLQQGGATLTLRPGSLDLLWEAVDAYTPPFYKGKALLPVGGAVKLTAIPAPSAPRNLSYNWSKNGSALPELSGYNRSSIALRHSSFDQVTQIKLDATSGTAALGANITISPVSPEAIAYKSNNSYINYAQGYTDTIPFTEPGAVIRVEPYFFSLVKNTLADLSFETKIDSIAFFSTSPNEFALTRPEQGGQSKLEVLITTVLYSLQNLTKTFTLAF